MGYARTLIAFDVRTTHTITCDVAVAPGELLIRYELRPVSGIVIPTVVAQPTFSEGLWEHTCFEAFVQVEGETGYREWNFSPSRDWATFAFSAYRRRLKEVPETLPRAPRMEGTPSDLYVSIPTTSDKPLRLGLTAVLEHNGGERSYWALAHSSSEPDFHRSESFLLKLAR